MSETVRLNDYDIVVSEGLEGLEAWLAPQAFSALFVLTDAETSAHCLPVFRKACPGLEFTEICVPAGEAHKNLATCEFIWKHLLDHRADRNAALINLGGGVIGDMGGFAASCYKRGIAFVNLPTTVLAQVDASIGGKLGVDFRFGKNLIGLFRNPARVHIATAFHATLSDRQYRNGFAEVFKHALIADAGQWAYYSGLDDLRGAGTPENLYRSLLIKKQIVEADPLERNVRKNLNFGHTIGHALETLALEASEKGEGPALLHGEAVAMGMIMESYLAHFKLGLDMADVNAIAATLTRHFGHYTLHAHSADTLWAFMAYDKKNLGNRVMAALIEAIGRAVPEVEIHRGDIDTALDFYNRYRP